MEESQNIRICPFTPLTRYCYHSYLSPLYIPPRPPPLPKAGPTRKAGVPEGQNIERVGKVGEIKQTGRDKGL